MGFLSGLRFGQYHQHSSANAQTAVAGLGRILQGKTLQMTKQTRGVVASFVRGESDQGSCSTKTGKCDVESNGMKLTVNGSTLAEREERNSNTIKVCIPAKLKFDPAKEEGGKAKANEKSREMVGAAAALMRVLGAGIGSRTIKDGERILTGGRMRRGGARVLVPGRCIDVRLTPEMVEKAADLQEATEKVRGSGEKVTRKAVRAEAARIRKERAKKIEELAAAKKAENLEKARKARAEKKAAEQEAAEAKKKGDKRAAEAAKKDAKKAAAAEKAATSKAKKAEKVEKKAKVEKQKAVSDMKSDKAAPKKASKKPAAKKPAAKKAAAPAAPKKAPAKKAAPKKASKKK